MSNKERILESRGENAMATKSILKTININNNDLCQSFARALKETQNTQQQTVNYLHECTEIQKENVKDFFANYQPNI